MLNAKILLNLRKKLFDAVDLGSEFELDFEASGRNGMFNSEQLYAIYDTQDLRELIAKLTDSLDRCQKRSNALMWSFYSKIE